MEFLSYLEQTSLSTFIRESGSLLAFPTVLCIHTLGLSLVAGINSILAIRVLGLASGIPLQSLKRLFPLMWLGMILSVLSGGALAMAKATTMFVNPILIVKLVMVVIACPIMVRMDKKLFRNPSGYKEGQSGEGRFMAASLLVIWTFVMISGRLIAYSNTIFGL